MNYLHMSSLCAIALCILSGCGFLRPAPKEFVSSQHKFSIAMPVGTRDPNLQKPKHSLDDKDALYSTTNDAGIYRVRVLHWSSGSDETSDVEDMLVGAGAGSGACFPAQSDAEKKQLSFQGRPALEMVGWDWSENRGADNNLVKLQKRMIGFRGDTERVFCIEMVSDKKENLTSAEANQFFNSFKLTS